MQAVYERKLSLRTSDFDRFNRLLPSAVMDFFQSAAGAHADDLGCGSADIYRNNMLWVVMRLKFELLRQPKLNEDIISRTWPLPEDRLGYVREHVVEDLHGNIIAQGATEWAVVNAETRKLMPGTALYPENLELCTERVIDGRLKRIRNFETDSEPFTVCPGYSCLDFNGHVNNIKYADFVTDALQPGKDENIKSFQIDFHREIMCGSRVRIYTKRSDGMILCKGLGEDELSSFACRIELA